jgi:peptidylamidoglycolate lyase
MRIKKLIFFLLLLAALVFSAYFYQPIKKGKGSDSETRYTLIKNWPQLPGNFKLGNPTGIAVDSSQNVIVFHRANRSWPIIGPMPKSLIRAKTILILSNNNGTIIDSWGENLFIMPHGLTVDKDNNIWVTDVGLHQVFKFSHSGKLLMKLGEAKVAGNDTTHFNKPTDIAVAEDGSFYVSDGYGNSRILKFSAAGEYLFEWGKKGNGNGEFNTPHGIVLDNNGHVYVADRENNRVQVFDPSGRFLKQWTDESFGNICAVAFDEKKSRLFATDDFTFLKMKHRGSDVFIFDSSGNVRTRFGRSGLYEGPVCWYHDITTDREGNIYVGDILGNTIQKFKKM